MATGGDVPPDAAQPTDTTVVTPDGALLNIPPVSDSPAPESVTDGSAEYPDDGVVLNIPAADAPIPAASSHDGSTTVVSQAENASVQENVSVAGGGTVLTFPQTGSVAPPASVNTPSPQEGIVVTGGERHTNTQTASSSQSSTNSQTVQSSTAERSHTTGNRSQHSRVTVPSLGGMIFSKSLSSGGSFANDVIGTVARGEVAGSITGEMAAQSLTSYMGYTAIKESSRDIPTYSDVEIGRGRITGVEAIAGSTDGLPFTMYHVEQYEAPSGEFQKVFSADGTQWYKQYAQDTVEHKPYKAPELIKKDLLSEQIPEVQLQQLAACLMQKPLSVWRRQEFGRIQGLSAADALRVLQVYPESRMTSISCSSFCSRRAMASNSTGVYVRLGVWMEQHSFLQ